MKRHVIVIFFLVSQLDHRPRLQLGRFEISFQRYDIAITLHIIIWRMRYSERFIIQLQKYL
jgi:hypothetical protein